MRFNTLYVSKWADGDPSDTRVIETETYTLHSMVVGDSCDREKTIADYCRKNGIHSVALCPGFTHAMVARISEAVGTGVSVAASRSDGPGSAVTGPVMREAGKGLKR
ncbi:MAG: DUF6506 family protein [Candidatus Aegiribacteria sp.]